MIDPTRVQEILSTCLSGSETAGILVEGIINGYRLDEEKLKSHRDEVIQMLEQLPLNFMDNAGGGWTFLNLCQDAQGALWTGEQRTMESLLCLAKGLGLADTLMDRSMWSAFPGGVPYVVFYRSKFNLEPAHD